MERLAVIETRMNAIERLQSEHRAETATRHKEVVEQLTALNTQLTKYGARWGGMLMLLSGIMAALTLSKDWLVGYFR